MKRVVTNWVLTEQQMKSMLYALDMWISTFDGDSDDGEYYELLQSAMEMRELTEQALYGKPKSGCRNGNREKDTYAT